MKSATTATLTLLLAASAGAQEGLRDPMQPPPALRAVAAAGGGTPADAAPAVARHLMVIDGVRYVIDNGRRRGVGDLLAGARIEHIEDSAIVVRNGKQLQRLPLFAGVVKRPVAAPASAGAGALTDTHTDPHTGTPTDVQPADPVTQTAQALAACADRPSCMQRPGEPR